MIPRPLFDPLEFLRVAENLVGGTPAERELRTATGRCYYALFLVARDRLQIKGKEKIHEVVINAVRHKSKHLGDQLGKLRRYRVTADYDLSNTAPFMGDWVWNWGQARTLAAYIEPKLKALP